MVDFPNSTTCNYHNPNPNSFPIPFPPSDNDIWCYSSNPNHSICSIHINPLSDHHPFIDSADRDEIDHIYLQFLDLFYQHQFNYYPHSPLPLSPTHHHHHYHHDILNIPPNNMPLENSPKDANNNNNNNDEDVFVVGKRSDKRKRNCKKDRHSKINTANGPRDRRMRLSLDVARKFFRLQDLLGFDKASRTVDWLLKNSDAAIRHLACTRRREAADLKGTGDEISASDEHDEAADVEEIPKMPSGKKGKGKKKKGPNCRATVGKESRRKARERARERTSQKRRLMYECNRTESSRTKLQRLPTCGDESSSVNDDYRSCQWNPSALLYGCAAGLEDQSMEQYLTLQQTMRSLQRFE